MVTDVNNISNLIEQHLKRLLAESIQDFIEIQRNELASHFNCVPSQINYVLTTRFSTGRGYIVESRRGGGGYIRIVKLPLTQGEGAELIFDISNLIGEEISQNDAFGLIRRLKEEGLVSQREAWLMSAAVDNNVLRVGVPKGDQLRAFILKAMMLAVLRSGK